MVEEIKPLDEPLDKVLDELMDGDILVFQLADPEILSTKDDFATARGYFRFLFNLKVTLLLTLFMSFKTKTHSLLQHSLKQGWRILVKFSFL